jgi:hypothetical protein
MGSFGNRRSVGGTGLKTTQLANGFVSQPRYEAIGWFAEDGQGRIGFPCASVAAEFESRIAKDRGFGRRSPRIIIVSRPGFVLRRQRMMARHPTPPSHDGIPGESYVLRLRGTGEAFPRGMTWMAFPGVWFCSEDRNTPVRGGHQSQTEPSSASYDSRFFQSWPILETRAFSSSSIPRPGPVGRSR